MLKNYYWLLFTILVLAVFLFFINILVRNTLTRHRKQLPRNFFIFTAAIFVGLLLFLRWLFDPRFHSPFYLIFSIFWIIGGILRLMYDWRRNKDNGSNK